jgi:hypothetical protein
VDAASVRVDAGPLAAAHEPPDRRHELVRAVLLLVLGAVDDAVAGVLVHEAERDLVQRGLDRADLREDVDAVAILVTMACMPRTWPSIRRRRFWSWSFVAE